MRAFWTVIIYHKFTRSRSNTNFKLWSKQCENIIYLSNNSIQKWVQPTASVGEFCNVESKARHHPRQFVRFFPNFDTSSVSNYTQTFWYLYLATTQSHSIGEAMRRREQHEHYIKRRHNSGSRQFDVTESFSSWRRGIQEQAWIFLGGWGNKLGRGASLHPRLLLILHLLLLPEFLFVWGFVVCVTHVSDWRIF